MKKLSTRVTIFAAVGLFSIVQSFGSIVTYGGEDQAGSLRDAIGKAGDGEVVTFDASITDALVDPEQIVITRDIIVDASALATRPKIRGYVTNEDGCMFKIPSGVTVRFIGLQFDSNASVAANFGDLTISDCLFTTGAGLRNETNGTMSLINCRFDGTQVGAINLGGSLQVSNSVFTHLSSDYSVKSEGGILTIVDSIFSENLNGPIWQTDGALNVARTTIVSNTIGGIAIYGGTATLTDTTVHGNGTRISNASAPIGNSGSLMMRNCVVSGNHGYRGGLANGGTAILNDCTFTENAGDRGGGIGNSGQLIATNTIVSQNSVTADGGGIANEFGALTLQNCHIDGNLRSGIHNMAELTARSCTISSNQGAAVFGGAIAQDSGSASLFGCTLQGNGAIRGGAIYQLGGTMAFTECNVVTNLASDYSGYAPSGGGGIEITGGDMVLNNSTIAGNSPGAWLILIPGSPFPGLPPRMVLMAGTGGGILASAGHVEINGCTLSANSGGAIYQSPTSSGINTMAIRNSTIASNTVASVGAGIYSQGDLQIEHSTIVSNYSNYTGASGGGIYAVKSFSLVNSIVAKNSADTSPDIVGSWTGSNNLIGVDPQISPLGDYGGPTFTMVPLPGSPALDAGTATTLRYDQRGLPRVVNQVPDIGAVEIDLTTLAREGAFMSVTPMASGAVELRFPSAPGQLLADDDLASPANTWMILGSGKETPPGSGIFRFEDKDAPAHPHRFYVVRY